MSRLHTRQEKTARNRLLVRKEHRERSVPLLRGVREGVREKSARKTVERWTKDVRDSSEL